MAKKGKKKESLEQRLKKAEKKAKRRKKGLEAPTKVKEEKAATGKVKLKRPSRRVEDARTKTETPFGPWNWGLLIAGVVVAGVGFVFLYFGDVVFSTTFLVLGYCVVIPVALLLPKTRKKPQQPEPEKEPQKES